MQPPKQTKGPVFRNRERVNIADPTTSKVPRRGMVDRMCPAPNVVGRQRQHAQHAPDPITGPATAEKGRMAAIMLDRKEPQQKARVDQRDSQR